MKEGIIGAFTGFLNGIFGSGGGSLAVPALEKFSNMKAHKAHATTIAIILPLSIISMFIYLKDVDINVLDILSICLGGMVGGFIGAKTLKKVPTKWLHKIFGAFMLAGAWRMIL